ncbi:hypothetical protein IW140_003584 [Coemansia sp. RSA 1813]|nr:hypothetical protein EV178_003447 [Coemansia sp. RSA 1646]KAJ1769321.1 hypothetical protein LPJ74_004148 [Coemansia sp. RSA 1843]KAJ2089107.1 hypothetical protein IW138_003687 [Coemansia sp. RSA 986]KAJ2215635.1 hypothetical protein EV179_002046 [Coemansia sp. RSA 487]KAJ2568827.1 hypothetical protein IW140_003584 [Coemansia sp. RSA 1813]
MDFKMPTREEQEEKISFWKDKIVGKTLVDDLSEEKDTHVVEQPRDKESEEQTSEVANQEEPSDQNVLLSSLPTPLRVIKPGSRVTRDLRPYRMNVMCSKEGVITDIKFF